MNTDDLWLLGCLWAYYSWSWNMGAWSISWSQARMLTGRQALQSDGLQYVNWNGLPWAFFLSRRCDIQILTSRNVQDSNLVIVVNVGHWWSLWLFYWPVFLLSFRLFFTNFIRAMAKLRVINLSWLLNDFQNGMSDWYDGIFAKKNRQGAYRLYSN